MEYGVGLAFSGAMSRLKVEQWICSMEEHMKINQVGSEDMVPYAVKYLVEEAATWWTMHQAIDELRRKITWKEFTRILLGSRLVTPTKRTETLRGPVPAQFAEKQDTAMKDTKMDAPIVKKFTGVTNAPLHKS